MAENITLCVKSKVTIPIGPTKFTGSVQSSSSPVHLAPPQLSRVSIWGLWGGLSPSYILSNHKKSLLSSNMWLLLVLAKLPRYCSGQATRSGKSPGCTKRLPSELWSTDLSHCRQTFNLISWFFMWSAWTSLRSRTCPIRVTGGLQSRWRNIWASLS